MNAQRWIGLSIACAVVVSAEAARAQPVVNEGARAEETAPSQAPAAVEADEASPASAAPAAAEPEPPAPDTPDASDAPPSADASASLTTEVATPAPVPPPSTAEIDSTPEPAPAPPAAPTLVTGSHIPRPTLRVDGALILDAPLTISLQDRESLQRRRQLGGIAPPDTTTALGLGAAGTSPSYGAGIELRHQPTLVLLNGRRLVAAPFVGPDGSDFVDLNQLPISLIERIETARGHQGGLYGDGAIGGVVNFITKRDYDGVEVDLGGQATDSFDQHEEDITLTLGLGSEKSGANAMVSYFTRQPFAASDSDWIGEREERTESLISNPGSYQPLVAFVEFPYPDPFCEIAQDAGHSSGLELRIPLFGETVTRDGRDVLRDPNLLPTSPRDYRQRYRMDFDSARGDGDGSLEAYETSTYCAGNFTSVQDLTLKDERVQVYTTLWHELTDDVEAFGELGFYRSYNENRTAPSLPITRIAPDPAYDARILVPTDHADQPIHYLGFSTNPDDDPAAHAPNTEFVLGRAIGLHAGSSLNTRRVDVLRGVLGLRGDLEDAGSGSVIETWDWELSGVYSASAAATRVPDILLDKLSEALASCPVTLPDEDPGSPTYGQQIPSTIKQRQELGCYNPFYNSVTNNAAIDPLGVSSSNPRNARGFIATDSESRSDMAGFGRQDGGYICDPNDPDSPDCPDDFDLDGDGAFELAGTPNTQQVIDRMTGEHVTEERRSLGTIDALLHGDIVQFGGGGLQFGVGGQYRRESLRIDYDAAYNRRLYAFVFGGPDVAPVSRNVAAGFGELRLTALDGLLEVQPAARVEHYDDVGTGVGVLGGLAVHPFVSTKEPALEHLLVRGHVGHGHRAPSLLQLHGTYTEFHSVEFADRLHFIPQQVSGNPDLDFEKHTTFSGGLQWDWAGIRVGADFFMTLVGDAIGSDNLQTLLSDCEAQYANESEDCPEVVLLTGGRQLNHVESQFDNLAEIETSGIDGGISYTLDSKRRGLGDFGTFVIGAQGTFINQYLIKSARALREHYRTDGGTPELNDDGSRDYSQLEAEYDAAGFRNLENFAPPMPKLRFSVPLTWAYAGHNLGVTLRYVGEYNDDSELTIEKYGLAPPGVSLADLSVLEGEKIPAWVVLDVGYGLSFGGDGWRTSFRVGVINLLDEPPPAAESPLGYDVGVHDPRGRLVYLRATGEI